MAPGTSVPRARTPEPIGVKRGGAFGPFQAARAPFWEELVANAASKCCEGGSCSSSERASPAEGGMRPGGGGRGALGEGGWVPGATSERMVYMLFMGAEGKQPASVPGMLGYAAGGP